MTVSVKEQCQVRENNDMADDMCMCVSVLYSFQFVTNYVAAFYKYRYNIPVLITRGFPSYTCSFFIANCLWISPICFYPSGIAVVLNFV